MLILALDSSTSAVTVAVARAGESEEREVLGEISIYSRGASEALLPAAHSVLTLVGADLDKVERILVGIGPGTFTGIRIALAAARSLSLATGAPLSSNSTLAALAAPALVTAESSEVLAVLDARRGQVFTQRFTESGIRSEILCAAPKEFMALRRARDAPFVVVGDGAVRYREELLALGRIPPDTSPLHQVRATGHVLSANLITVPAHEVVPLYVREPDAEVRKDLNPWSTA
ncbi:MAG: tRNA (adenosine(37)-N6)-threonylcarbamoyltransferase complex dimerization subunit type 1 TsaB [Actinomycetota bacterium]|nr:tRNA (adenosine(37)-N6)-threonylcarbamoyltransferase complex dimerization subunit type 1 TsaB [Actinomycetota bacterium]